MKFAKRCAALVLIFAQGGHAFRKRAGARVQATGLRGPQEPKALLEELEEQLGATSREALPKNQRGALEAPSARYALHRLFNKRHGWQIKGLETAGGTWDSESPVVAMGDRVPPQMRELLEERLGSYGLTLHELAVLAATMEGMFEQDVEQRLRIVYAEKNLAAEEKVYWDQAMSVMWSYVAAFITGTPVESLSPGDVRRATHQFAMRFPRHVEAKTLLIDITQEIVGETTTAQYDVRRLAQKGTSRCCKRSSRSSANAWVRWKTPSAR